MPDDVPVIDHDSEPTPWTDLSGGGEAEVLPPGQPAVPGIVRNSDGVIVSGGEFETLVGDNPEDIGTWDFHMNPTPARIYFVCPWCGTTVEQSVSNFHYWCPACKKNGRDFDFEAAV